MSALERRVLNPPLLPISSWGARTWVRPYKTVPTRLIAKTLPDPTNKTPDFQKEKDGATAAANWTNKLTMTIY